MAQYAALAVFVQDFLRAFVQHVTLALPETLMAHLVLKTCE